MIKSKKFKNLTFIESLNESFIQLMNKDKNVIIYGLDVDDEKGINGSTLNLKKKLGKKRDCGRQI